MENEANAVATQPEQQTDAIQVNEKQLASVTKIIEGIVARQLGDRQPNFTQYKEGQDLFLSADNWPTIKIGKAGGVSVVDLRSYPEGEGKTAIDAAINGDVLLEKQKARDLKRAAQPAQTAQAPQAPQTPQTPTQNPAYPAHHDEAVAAADELEEELEAMEEETVEAELEHEGDETAA